MATYVYRCVTCGDFEVARPLGEAAAGEPCPVCADPGRRVWTAPRLGNTGVGMRLAATEERSAHAPAVTSGPPARPGVSGSGDPRHARLPRP
ncbi:zinc ribbon domain-containing protein [Streptomyces sp. SID3343]|uniref:FmdB family zinc ribbon protein n=1 Tax=Streptomyces sp. SID3343 TaxID=2690260 RepID=UPI00136EA52F|nr:zinc ribbon domain-containing protein [Streptomyces sp. SID3343]MYV97654.1 zinc ribbon domain-containing protein [Streptomyces sp. SID3343]